MRKSDKWAICVISLALVACGGDGSPAGQNDPDPSVSQTLSKLAGATVVESGGLVGEAFVIELENAGANTLASLTSKPNGSVAVLTTVTPGLRFTFIPDVEGVYELTFIDGGEVRVTRFDIKSRIPYDTADLMPGTGGSDLTGLLGSQFVFYTSAAKTVAEQKLLSNYPEIGVVGFDGPFVYVSVDRNSDVQVTSLERLKQDGIFEYYGNRRIEDVPAADYMPDDGSRFDDEGDNWHLEKIRAPEAWDLSRGSADVSIGVMDQRVASGHPELKGRLIAVKNPSFTEDANLLDFHGTAVVSAIAGVANNGRGVTGVNHFSKINFRSYRLREDGSWYSKYQESCLGNKVVNHSWGRTGWVNSLNPVTGEKFSQSFGDWASGEVSRRIDQVVLAYPVEMFWSYYSISRYARIYANTTIDRDCLMVTSAGNDGMDSRYGKGSMHYESKLSNPEQIEFDPLDNVLVVAALRRNGNLSDISNYGESVDVAAPTEYKAAKDSLNPLDGYYESETKEGYGAGGGFNGTSAAAPLVTGVASLIASKYPQFNAATIKRIIVASAKNNGYVTRRDAPCKTASACGSLPLLHPIPILDAKGALELAATIAAPPSIHFSSSLASPKVGDLIRFTPTVAAANGRKVTSYQWSFGDGEASTSSVPSPVEHSFANPGTYTVQLYVVDDAGVSNLSSTRVTVQPKPVVTTPSLSINFGPGSRTLLGAENFQAVDFISGREGRYAAKFGGISNPGYIRIPNQAAMQFTDGATFDLWARLDSLTGMDGYGRTVSNGAYAMTLLAKSHDRYGASFMVNSMTQTSSAWIASFDPSMNGGCERVEHPVVPLGVWRRITYVLSSTTGTQVYVNKRLAYQCPSARPDFTQMNSRDLYIGKFSDVWYPLDGAIQDIRIYKSALSAEQVAALN